MHESINDICKAIDENLLRNLELMEEKINVNIQMENMLRDGHIELAKAKYIRGKESISILQVPDDEEKVVALFELETNLTEETGKIIPNFDLSLKKSDKDGDEIPDPIKWFGVLVPQSLRIAQKRFQESLFLAVRSANIQAEIVSVLDKLKSLYFLKNAYCPIDGNKN
ncbi:vacuolar ATPase assembly protein VMA22 [Nomia melanderi]|uniref:vacuolar ATPase assembly protein VMA22 n=1 Tax=Nomia melanderi TaxID=2448451 RepID=UPI0013043B4D|nr:coiled-coil domain-containing protein 115-like [Nomia melanderi]XP_031848580.1 coiled-coil domain-containing protein 115-like [Nomia melanderi]